MTDTTKMKLGLGIILAAALVAGYYGCGGSSSSDSGSSAVYEATGVLDDTFGISGTITSTIGTSGAIKSIALQADGKILAIGQAHNGSDLEFALARYTVTGTLDADFAIEGIITPAFSAFNDMGQDVIIQTDGNIIVGGYISNGTDEDFGLARYTISGTLDTTFSVDGVVTTTIGAGDDYCDTLGLQSDGKILAAGRATGSPDASAIVRYNTSGTVSTTFGGGDGIVTTTIGTTSGIQKIIVLPDDTFLAAGFSNGATMSFALAKYTSLGALDTTFGGGDGVVTTTVGGTFSSASAMARMIDGRIMLGGYANRIGGNDLAQARFSAIGALEASITTTVGTDDDSGISGMAVQSNGKILVTGWVYNAPDYDMVLVRYNTNGTLDTTFGGGDGVVMHSLGSGDSEGYCLTVQPNGYIVVAGYADNHFSLWRFK